MDGPYSGRFRLFVSRTIEFEVGNRPNGGWNKHESDHGGATQWGISSNYNKHVSEKIKAGVLTKEEAIGIYFKDYYRKIYNVEKLPASIAFLLFDSRVHGSIRSTVSDIQRLINFLTGYNLKVDGAYGPNTFRAIQTLDSSSLATLLMMMKVSVPQRAAKVAMATMRTQQRKGLPTYDYSNGFRNRFRKRIEVAVNYA